jgi:hypothetical protein
MPNVLITLQAANYIRAKLVSPVVLARRESGALPRLKWASRVSLSKPSGQATELGPRFFFSWTNPQECRNEGDLIVQAPGFGSLSLAPGNLLAAEPHTIDVQDDHLVLIPPISRT